MATSVNDGSGWTTVSGASWASTANGYDGSGTTYATLTTTTAGDHVIDITGFNFASSVSLGSTLTSVVVNVSQYVASASRWDNPTVQAYDDTTAIGSPVTLTERTAAGNENVTLSSVTLAQVRSANFKIRFTAKKSGTTSSVQNFGRANVTVTFTAPAITDAEGVTDLPSLTLRQVITDAVGVTDPTVLPQRHLPTLADTAAVTDSLNVAIGQVVADAGVGITDVRTVAQAFAHTRTIPDAVGLTDANTRRQGLAVADGLGLTDAAAGRPQVAAVDPVGIADALTAVRRLVLTDAEALTDARTVGAGTAVARTPADTLGVTDSLTVGWTQPVTDAGVGLTDPAPTVAKSSSGTSWTRSVDDTVGAADALTEVRRLRADDTVGVADTAAESRRVALTDAQGLTDARTVNQAGTPHSRTPADTQALSDAVSVVQTTPVADAGVGITDVRTVAHVLPQTWTVSLTDHSSIVDAFLSVDTVDEQTDAEGLTDALAVARRIDIADSLGLADAPTKVQRLRVTDAEGLTDAPAVDRGARASRDLFDTTNLTDATAVARVLPQTRTDDLALADTVTLRLSLAIRDAVDVADARTVTRDGASSTTLPDPLGVTDTLGIHLTRAVADDAGLADTAPTVGRLHTVTITDTVDTSDTIRHRQTVTDRLALSDDIGVQVGANRYRLPADTSHLTDDVAVVLARVVTVDDLLDLIDLQAMTRTLTLVDVVPVTDPFSPSNPVGRVRAHDPHRPHVATRAPSTGARVDSFVPF